MRLILRFLAFLGGLIACTLVIGVLNDVFPWFWLPTLFGCTVGCVAATQTWLKESRLAFFFPTTMGLGAALTFSLTTTPVINRFGPDFPKLMLLIGGALFVVSLIIFLRRGWSSPKTKTAAIWLLIPIIAACIVGYVSGGIGGSNHMVSFLTRYFHVPQELAVSLVRVVRKTIHFSAYGFVGLSAFKAAYSARASLRGAIGFAMALVLCLASFDEMRQTTAPNRTGSYWDVLLDMCGAFAFVLAAAMLAPIPAKKSTLSKTRAKA